MQVTFRQGILQAPDRFLRLNDDKTVSIQSLTDVPVAVVFAHKQSNYIHYERLQSKKAWAGPFETGFNYWLYWDIDLTTGVVTYNHTSLKPVYGSVAPPSPKPEQFWFDTDNTTSYVWTGASWRECIRVFAAKIQGNSEGSDGQVTTMPPFMSVISDQSVQPAPFVGSQVGLSNIDTTAGMILYSVRDKPLRSDDGTFLTTSDTAIVGLNTASQIKPGSLLITASAIAPLPAYSVVKFVDFNKVDLASSADTEISTYGFVEHDVDTGEPCNVSMEGVIRNPKWNWSHLSVNDPLYLGAAGELTDVPPPVRIVIGNVIDQNTVLIRPAAAVVETMSVIATTDRLGTVLISALPTQETRRIVAITGGVNSKVEFAGDYVADVNALNQIVIEGHPDVSLNRQYKVLRAESKLQNTVAYVVDVLPTGAETAGFVRLNVLPRALVKGDPSLGSLTPTQKQFMDSLDQLGAGIIGKDNAGNAVIKTLVQPPEGIAITNASGQDAPGPEFHLANDLAALEGLGGVGFAVRTGIDAWATRILTADPSHLVISDASGITSNPSFSLAKISSPVTSSLVRITTDEYGRVVATAPITASDLTSVLSDFYVKTSGSVMTGPLSLSSDPVLPEQAATKHYVDYVVSGSMGPPNTIYQQNTNITITDTAGNGDGIVRTVVDGIPVIQTTSTMTAFDQEVSIGGVVYPPAGGTEGQVMAMKTLGTAEFKTLLGNNVKVGAPTSASFGPGAITITPEMYITNVVDHLNTTLGKLLPSSPPNFPGAQTLQIMGLTTGRMCAFTQTNNTLTGSKQVAGGTVVSARRSASYTTNTINDVGPGDVGDVTAIVNSMPSGSKTLTAGNDDGTYGSLIISNNVDYGTITGQPQGFWQSYDASASGTVQPGWNELLLSHQNVGVTNTIVWYCDGSIVSQPAYNQLSFAPKSTTVLYSSSVPHYTKATTFELLFTTTNLSGDTYPTSDTFVAAPSSTSFSSSSLTYAQANISLPLARNAYSASPTPSLSMTFTVNGGTGSSPSVPSVTITNGYAQSTTPVAISGIINRLETGVLIDERAITVASTVGTGTSQGYRVGSLAGSDTPAITSTSAFDSQALLASYEATVVGGKISHDQTNYSVGYLPVGPNLSTGRAAPQYITLAFARPSVGKFDIVVSGSMAGCWAALPTSSMDAAASPSNGWVDAMKAYQGAGLPGTGATGNGSTGCAVGGPLAPNTNYTNKRVTVTFGPANSSNTTSNLILVRIKLTPGQNMTSIMFDGATN